MLSSCMCNRVALRNALHAALLWRPAQVQQLAAAHHCYSVLFEACERLDAATARAAPADDRSGGRVLHTCMASLLPELGSAPGDTFARHGRHHESFAPPPACDELWSSLRMNKQWPFIGWLAAWLASRPPFCVPVSSQPLAHLLLRP
jgi:hypothetical protein